MQRAKPDLGQNINVVHDAFLKHRLGQKINQEALSKVLKPVTDQLSIPRVPRRTAPVSDYAADDDHVQAVPDHAPDELNA